MIRQAAGSCIVLVLALGAASAAADSPPPVPRESSGIAGNHDPDGEAEAYRRAQRDLFDTLSGDASPRVQVLAGRIYLDEDDLSGGLRPKPEDVAERAAQLAPDDAFVQWAVAHQGSFAGSQCGPTRWPEAEVARLVRLEPDNAGALQFAAALAHAKGDQAALDDALARMAAASRADDHLGEETAAWRKIYATRPMEDWQKDAGMTPQTAALYRALVRTSYHTSSAAPGLKEACSPDAQSERTWQRLGWCTDAGRLLAGRGNSFALRALGLDLLEASGAQSDEIAELRRQFDWLQAHAAGPMAAFGDSAEDQAAGLVADWQGASSEIVAAERRLDRTGQPRTAPAGWVKAAAKSHKDDTQQQAAAWQTYMRALIEDMRGSSDVRAQALALTSGDQIVRMFDAASADEKKAPATEAKSDPLAELAAANADDLVLQWIAATSFDRMATDATARAVANVQRLDADNAAAWAMSLPSAGADVQPVLQRMAAASRYDEHVGEMLGLWFAAIQKRPIPAAVMSLPIDEAISAEAAGKSTALALAMMNSISASPFGSLAKACRGSELDDAQRKDTCIAIGRLLLNSSRSVVSAGIGESLLRNADALGADEQARARQLAWWHSVQSEAFRSGDAAIEAYFADYLATGNEIEALRLNASRAGKGEPPAGWLSPNEKRAAKKN
jgi:hypothetical protein